MQVISLELNEINFDLIKKYIERGQLPVFQKILSNNDLVYTTSEPEYEHQEPWIQWVTAYTGMSFSEHQVFRLGDIVQHDYRQIWEEAEDLTQRSVVAISPMNAKNRVSDRSVFVPDPWTNTEINASFNERLIYGAVREAVNNNAKGDVGFATVMKLFFGILPMLPQLDFRLLRGFYTSSRKNKWYKALILDCLLTELFVRSVDRINPGYASLFLNAGAHIQHHYMYDCGLYSGSHKNPEGYKARDVDPLLEVYRFYELVIQRVSRKFPGHRLVITTGLSQKPNPEEVYYYRPKDHRDLLARIGVNAEQVEPRMSRDMLLRFSSESDKAEAIERLSDVSVRANGKDYPLFNIDDRGASVFCKVDYTQPNMSAEIYFRGIGLGRICDHFVHVSIENGIHRSLGFFIDVNGVRSGEKITIPLTELKSRILGLLSKTATLQENDRKAYL